jgi:hypothetical protein
MKKYIFYSTDGFTQDNNLNDVENCQVLGWEAGNTPTEAWEKLRKSIEFSGLKNISSQELKNDKTYRFSF